MKTIIVSISLLLCLSGRGYAAPRADNSVSIQTLIDHVKQSSSTKARQKALQSLKLRLKGMKRHKRIDILSKLQKSLHANQHNSHNRASEILSAFGNGGGHAGGMGSGGGHGGGHGGGGGGNGGGGGGNGGR